MKIQLFTTFLSFAIFFISCSNETEDNDSQSPPTTVAIDEDENDDDTNSDGSNDDNANEGDDNEEEEEEEDNNDDDTTASIPGALFNLNTLQIETSWNSAGTSTVSQDAVTFGTTDYYFVESDKMILVSKAADGKRTELKERPSEERPLTVEKELNYMAQVFNIPENGVTIAQVHNRANGVTRPLVRVYIDDDRRIKFKLTDNPVGDSEYETINGPLYVEGEDLEVNISIAEGAAYFYASTTAGTVEQSWTPSEKWAPYPNGYYLKAGVYTEGDDTLPEIHFSVFTLEK